MQFFTVWDCSRFEFCKPLLSELFTKMGYTFIVQVTTLCLLWEQGGGRRISCCSGRSTLVEVLEARNNALFLPRHALKKIVKGLLPCLATLLQVLPEITLRSEQRQHTRTVEHSCFPIVAVGKPTTNKVGEVTMTL